MMDRISRYRRQVQGAAVVVLIGALAWSQPAVSQAPWPDRPIKVIVPFPAGGQLDLVVRLIAEKISPALGQPIVVETRTGADGNIAAEMVAKSPADGYTWLSTSVPFTTQVTLQPKNTRYDPLRDFAPVANLGTSSFVLVVPTELAPQTLAEFVAYAKARPGKLSYGGTSAGSVTHLSTEMFKRAAGIEMEMIPYAGIPPAIADLVSGRTQFMSLGLVAAQAQIKGGKVRPLAVLDPERNRLLPGVPSIAEAGFPGVTAGTWFGLLMPAGTPPAIVQRVNAEIVKATQSPDVLAKFEAMGVAPVKPHTPEQFGAFLKEEVARWAQVIRDAGVKIE